MRFPTKGAQMKTDRSDRRRRGGRRLSALVFAAAVAVAALAITAFAVAKSTTLGVAMAKLTGPSGMRSEPVAVNSRGVALYDLVPETTHHLLCTSSACLSAWPPLKVASGAKLTKAAGISGKLGKLRRKGFTQVTLNGHPLYTFVEDGGKKGGAAGDGLVAFGGTWHVFKEGHVTNSASTPAPAPAPAPIGYTAPSSTTTTTTSSPSGW
jgi:predicted lipoprotein with Yx(FWY)xxD motif